MSLDPPRLQRRQVRNGHCNATFLVDGPINRSARIERNVKSVTAQRDSTKSAMSGSSAVCGAVSLFPESCRTYGIPESALETSLGRQPAEFGVLQFEFRA